MAAPELKVDLAAAFNRVRSAPAAPRFGFRLPVMRPGSRPMVLAFAATIALAGLIVTAIAQGGTFFSPTTVEPVPITVADIPALTQFSAYGALTLKNKPALPILPGAHEAYTISSTT